MSLCDFTTPVTVYVGRGNTVTVQPLINVLTNEPLNMLAVTSIRVCIGGAVGSSTDDPSYVTWDQNDDDEWLIHFQPGMFTNIPTGEHMASITVYSGDYPDGLVLTHTYPLNIIEIC
jgi:hypothetical protein